MGWVKFKIAQLGCKLKWVRVEKKVILSNLGICLVKRVMFATQLKVIFSFLESEYVYVWFMIKYVKFINLLIAKYHNKFY